MFIISIQRQRSQCLPKCYWVLVSKFNTACTLSTSQTGTEIWSQLTRRTKHISHCCSVAQMDFLVMPRTAARQASLSYTNSQSLLKVMSIKLMMPSNHLILCHPLLLLSSTFPSIRVFSNELALCIRWPKYWSFSFSISPSNEYSGLISFKIDWFDLLAVQGTLKSLLQHHSLKTSILLNPDFFFFKFYFI